DTLLGPSRAPFMRHAPINARCAIRRIADRTWHAWAPPRAARTHRDRDLRGQTSSQGLAPVAHILLYWRFESKPWTLSPMPTRCAHILRRWANPMRPDNSDHRAIGRAAPARWPQ